jgi:hypothetical protein
MRLPIIACLLVVAAAAGCAKAKNEPTTDERIAQLEQRVEQERRASAAAPAAYVPQVPGSIEDLGAPAADILRQLPGVAGVEVLVACPKPTHRIIHLRDWHFVPRDLFALDVRQSSTRPLSEQEVDALYREHLLQVELVQLEQVALLRALAKHHGLRRVLLEGLTPEGIPSFRDVVAALRDTQERLGDLAQEHAKVRGKSPAVDQEVDELLRRHREELLPYGAAVHLVLAHEVEVLPLDEQEALDRAKPGKATVDPPKLEARHAAQVQAALASERCSLLVLGGSHDLSVAIDKLSAGGVEYLRVTTSRFKEVSNH